ncbi:hypothetical protein JCM10908_000933 [Rhodotorula pacifica]|uniref:uncharacterized protein n=1 Tax=Rhodotorula pacifica TaxID=1495444 RepID=UPI003175DBC5
MATVTSVNAPAPENPELVIRKLNNAITIFSVPFARMGVVPFGGRTTAVKLQDGSVWLAASHPLTPSTLQALAELGPIKHIVMLDAEHGMYTKQYHDAYPAAKLYFPARGIDSWRKKSWLPTDASQVFAYGAGCKPGEAVADPFEATTGGEIKSADFGKAFINEDIAFLHAPTRTLIEADLLLNLPPKEQYERSTKRASLPFLSAHMHPGTHLHQRFIYSLASKDKVGMKAAAEKVAAWDFDRIIPCHGDVIETGGKKAWLDTYAWFLEQ